MAEGYLQNEQMIVMENVGNQFLKVLLQNSLLQVVDKDEYGEVTHCSMHDLVHDVADSVSNGTYYKGDEWVPILIEQAKWLRTLIYNGKIHEIVFSNFKSLHSLTLRDREVKRLPDSIKELIHLRYLDISDTRIRHLPNSIGKLSYLQTIRYLHPSGESGLKKMPSTLKHLLNLRHLYLADDNTILPPRLGMLTSLQTLPWFKVHNKEGHRIVELESLKILKGDLKIYNLEEVHGEEESEIAFLILKGIVRLALVWRNGIRDGEINDESVLKGLQPHPNLKALAISGFKGASFPLWTLMMTVCLEGRWIGLNKLTMVNLINCAECEEIPTLGHLPHLKSLYLSGLKKVKSIGASFYGIKKCSPDDGIYKETLINVFPTLERLKLSDMTMLTEWEEVEIPSGARVNAFPRLEYLKIRRCKELKSAPSNFTSLKVLKMSDMDSELPLVNICSIKLKTLTKLEIGRVEGLICLPEWLFHNNNSLPALSIYWCPKLRDLPDGLHSLNSLEELKLAGSVSCGSKLHGLTSLRSLAINIGIISEMEESCAPLLEDLGIYADDSDACDCLSFNKAVDGILRSRTHSLRKLNLDGREDWESLPDQLQHCTSLSDLWLSRYGLKELPEWHGNLSSLQKLWLYQCTKLKHLPSMEAMQRLTNLTTLDFTDCPLLKKRVVKKQIEWPKISHLPNIYVDEKQIQYDGQRV